MIKNPTGDRWEKRLNIKTLSSRHEKDDLNHSRYEPTPYSVLERLSESGFVSEKDELIDYGSGKGRVGFFMTNVTGCRSIGVEFDPRMHAAAEENLSNYMGKRERVSFALENAENYRIQGANRFYFFNPFSVRILKSVLSRIYESYYENPRRILLFFYYALDAYVSELMNDELLIYEGEIDCVDLFHNADEKEKILIFSLG
ncbi:MAG: class I SAM-dependent methyltransferase [Clostridiales bacterium]|nr:class I SAM-dependent methyltransferase [Clostridiales bacterium]